MSYYFLDKSKITEEQIDTSSHIIRTPRSPLIPFRFVTKPYTQDLSMVCVVINTLTTEFPVASTYGFPSRAITAVLQLGLTAIPPGLTPTVQEIKIFANSFKNQLNTGMIRCRGIFMALMQSKAIF